MDLHMKSKKISVMIPNIFCFMKFFVALTISELEINYQNTKHGLNSFRPGAPRIWVCGKLLKFISGPIHVGFEWLYEV